MGPAVDVAAFLRAATSWAERTPDVVGLALARSHARGAAGPDSDIDLVLIGSDCARLLRGGWATRFGDVKATSVEDYGALKSLRVHFADGLEVEFGIAGRSWAEVPLDRGTRSVVASGFRVLYDPEGLLEAARDAAAVHQRDGAESPKTSRFS